jgi:hypothetical protein
LRWRETVESSEIERILAQAESALTGTEPGDLRQAGFWRAIAAVKREPVLVERYAARIGRIDRAAFERNVMVRLPAWVGVVLDLVGMGIGLVLMFIAPAFAAPWRELSFLVGVAAILGASHTLAHWLVGSVYGIGFSHWFSKPPLTPQPGFKTDYASYLRTPARRRAWMHASGAIVTKLVPFAALPLAVAAGLDAWALWLLLIVGIGQLFTDALLSTRLSDWKRFRREMRFAKESAGRS